MACVPRAGDGRVFPCTRRARLALGGCAKPTSKFWGVSWNKGARRWMAQYRDANGKMRAIGYFDTQEDAAHAVNAAIRRAGLEKKRHMNPVVDGQLVPKSGPRRGPT